MLQVVRFPEAVEAAVEELMPNRITDYLYDLSEKFNGFYTECHVSLHPLWGGAPCDAQVHMCGFVFMLWLLPLHARIRRIAWL